MTAPGDKTTSHESPVRSSDQIRQDFFDFFREKHHLIVESASVVPREDPTLLFINAGMNPFKPIFLDEEKGLSRSGKTWRRVANTQKCIRVSGKHNDLDEVGHDTYHHTLFEMLGNWSFGDYFKKEAIAWAWELLVDRWGLDPGRLYATVFEGDQQDGLPADEEAESLWASETGILPGHILRFGKKDNFWEMGETGPCGPCSEVHVDLRPDEERKKTDGAQLVNRDDPRVMEIWNLVFIQFNRQKDGSLQPLPARHVDTGMGFERMVAVMQGKTSNYDTDVFQPLIRAVGQRANLSYGDSEKTDIAMRVIADHVRAVSFAIADGAAPGNEDRGYVIRRILRRASRYAWDRLEIREAFMSELVDVLAGQFQNIFPELTEKSRYIKKVIRAEEESFLKTLEQGISYFQQMSAGASRLSGDDVFKLHDTYGFPVDLTQLMAREQGISIDLERFNTLMQQQRDRARKAGKFNRETADGSLEVSPGFEVGPDVETLFTGYDELAIHCRILDAQPLQGKYAILLDRSPFYAESGGQVADTGTLVRQDGQEELKVLDVQHHGEYRIHFTDKLPEHPGGMWLAKVDLEARRETERHHSATHLLHAVLRQVLGDHVAQKGSLVAPDRLRFDFSHYEPVSPSQLDEIEALVNGKIMENILLIEERDVPVEEAKKRGAMMLFGEKYGDHVRVITFDPSFSVELCGGTHVKATGQIGYFRFISESSVAAGVRRVEALTGWAAGRLLRNEKQALESIRSVLGKNADPGEEILRLIEEKKQLEKQMQKWSRLQAGLRLDELISGGYTTPEGILLVTGELEGLDMPALKQMGYDALSKCPDKTVIVLGARDPEAGKVFLMAAVTPDLIERDIKAGPLVGRLAKIVGGGGGGQPNLATAGGKLPEKLPEVFQEARKVLS